MRSQSRASYSSSAGVTTTEQTSQASQPSLRQALFPATLAEIQRRDGHGAISNDDLESLQGDGLKLSLLVQAKAIEDQGVINYYVAE